jgi:uncharacterized integral membrane protein
VRLFNRFVIWPILAVAIVFAIVNRAPVRLNLWPFPFTINVPLFVLILATLALGVLIGGFAAWSRGGRWRRRARADERRIAELERALAVAEASPPRLPSTLQARSRVPATAGAAPRRTADLEDE